MGDCDWRCKVRQNNKLFRKRQTFKQALLTIYVLGLKGLALGIPKMLGMGSLRLQFLNPGSVSNSVNGQFITVTKLIFIYSHGQ